MQDASSPSHASLITPAALADAAARRDPLVIIDTRSPEDYAKGHIPGAVNLREIFTYLATSTADGLRALEETFAALLGAAGVSGNERVVIYEDAMNNGNGQSCRGWFLLEYLGHRRVSVLHGGLRAWLAEGRPLATEAPAVEKKTFSPRVDRALMVTWEHLRDALGDPAVVKLDVRDHPEWNCECSAPGGKNLAARKGRIPGAVWIEWHRMMEAGNGVPRFRSSEEVREICKEVGIEPTSKVYIYCYKGARAANTLLALRSAGFDRAGLYLGSWNEWAADPRLPVEDGPPDPARMARRAP